MLVASQAALEIILQAKDEAGSVISSITGKLGGLGTMAGGAALAGVAAVGGGMALVGKTAFDFSQDVDAAMNLLQAQTGASAEEIESFKQVALDVYSAGWGESVDDVATSMATVNNVLGVTGDDLDAATGKALIMRNAFGVEVAESMAVVNQLMTNMGVSSDEAFDVVTTGLQNGLDAAGDFQDTLNEYSSDFARLGFDAEDMLNTLNAGLGKAQLQRWRPSALMLSHYISSSRMVVSPPPTQWPSSPSTWRAWTTRHSRRKPVRHCSVPSGKMLVGKSFWQPGRPQTALL